MLNFYTKNHILRCRSIIWGTFLVLMILFKKCTWYMIAWVLHACYGLGISTYTTLISIFIHLNRLKLIIDNTVVMSTMWRCQHKTWNEKRINIACIKLIAAWSNKYLHGLILVLYATNKFQHVFLGANLFFFFFFFYNYQWTIS